MRSQHIIGLTGGIGSGKSTVARMLQVMGYPVFDADAEVKALYKTSVPLQHELVSLFGEEVMRHGEVQKDYLAQKLFGNEPLRRALSKALAPILQLHFEQWCAQTGQALVVKEAAILIESGSYKNCDYIIQVTAPANLRLQRVMHRSGLSAEEIKQRMASQMSDEQRSPFCHATLVNDGIVALLPQLLHVVSNQSLFKSQDQ
jgi:dephospho-CoA kinase